MSYLVSDEADLDKVALLKVLTIMKSGDPKDAIWYLSATGDVHTLHTYLQRYPDEVSTIIIIIACV